MVKSCGWRLGNFCGSGEIFDFATAFALKKLLPTSKSLASPTDLAKFFVARQFPLSESRTILPTERTKKS